MAALEPQMSPAPAHAVLGEIDAAALPWLRGTLIGLISVAALTVAKVTFADVIGEPTPFLLYFGAVLVAAWYGGMTAGLLTTAMSAVLGVALFVHEPVARLSYSGPQAALYLIEGFAISSITSRLSVERMRALAAVRHARTTMATLDLSREWFSTALHSIGDAVIATDALGRINFLNPVAESLTQWTSAKAEGRPLSKVFPIVDETTRKPGNNPVDRVIREGVVVGLANHTLLLRPDGTELAIDDSAAPIRNAEGELVGVILVFRDVSHERRDQQRRAFLVRASEEMNASLDYESTLATVARLAVPTIADWCAIDVLDGASVRRLAVAHVDPAKVESVREIERRYPPDPQAPRGVHEILRTGRAEMLAEIPAALIESAARDEQHLRLIRELALRSYIGVPLTRGGKTFGVITLVMAESQRTYGPEDLVFAKALADRAAIAIENSRLFAEVEQARADAVLANRAKDEFLAMLGHELRNPLAPILTSLELMRLQAEGPFARERTVIERQVKHLVRLVDDLLDVSRITRGRLELEKRPVEIADVVDKAREMVGPLIDQRGHRLDIDVPRGLLVLGDAVRLAQVVANLLTNAAKYTEPGGRLAIVAETDDRSVLVHVRDSGIGIAPEMLQQIFELFVQEPQALDRAQGGLGLGLSIVRSLVAMHGGSVTARSAGTGQGSEFVVQLPALGVANELMPTVVPTPRAVTGPLRVLVVDDNIDARDLLAELLEHIGHEAHVAADGPSALALAPSIEPALALLDIGLPGMDGYELAGRLRELPGWASVPMVAVTGYGQPSDRARSSAAGFAAHLVKPVTLDSIRDVIARLATTR